MGDDGREGMSERGRDDRQAEFEKRSDRQKARERESEAVNNNNQHHESCYNKYDMRSMKHCVIL